MVRGRPTKTTVARNRKHSIYLDERAERLFRKTTPYRPKGWLNQYVSEHIKIDFGKGAKEGLVVQEIIELQRARDSIEIKLKEKAKELNDVRNLKIQRAIDERKVL